MSNSAGSFPLFMTLMTLLITLPLTAMFYSRCTTFIQLSHNVKVSVTSILHLWSKMFQWTNGSICSLSEILHGNWQNETF